MITDVAVVADQIQKFWSPLFMKELRARLLLGSLVNKDYSGQIKAQGDTVKVSQINAPVGENKTVGVDADTFSSESMTTTQVEIKADKRAVAAFEITDLAALQSQIGAEDSEIRASLLYAVEKQVNDYLYTLVAPSLAAPNHSLVEAAMNATALLTVRKLAAQAKWLSEKGWWGLLDPIYMNDILSAQTLTSSDYVGDEKVVVSGQVANKRFGFNLLEDNSRTSALGLFFHPDFMHLVMQTQPTFKVSDLHAQKKFAYLISVDMVYGAKLGIDGAKKHIRVRTS